MTELERLKKECEDTRAAYGAAARAADAWADRAAYTANAIVIFLVITVYFSILSFKLKTHHEEQMEIMRNQTTLLKNVSEQLSEIRSEFTILPNPEGWEEK